MRRALLYILLLTAFGACKEKYDLPYSGPATGYLVVDGTINSGQGPTNIRITRTLALVDSIAFRNETGAAVVVEGENNTQFPLFESGSGVYSNPQLNLQQDVSYRLRIQTSEGKVYHSEFTPNKKTPEIDDISWERSDRGVELYIDTHDPQDNTRYYKWDYEETWEFHSAYLSMLTYVYNAFGEPVNVAERPYDEIMKMYTCWQRESSSNILVGSSAKLSRDTIHLPLKYVENDSWKISVLYSILVRQHALSAAGYEFLQRMKKNTEQVGSLFDAQPSELVGNIKSDEDPQETVIGFVEVSEAKEKRIFIRRNQVIPWNYRQGCVEESILNHPDSLRGGLIPTSPHILSPFGAVIRFYASAPFCVDCRTRGSNVKPSFWP